jgi:hypothetical protein
VANVHTAAAITSEAHFIEGFCIGFTFALQLLEFFPFVGDYCATAKTSYWNNHHITSSVGLLLLSASTTSKLVFGFFTTRVVNEKTSVKAKVFITEFFVNTFCSTVVVDESTGNGGTDCVGLSHDSATVRGYGNVNLAQTLHSIGDNQWFHRLAASKGWL